MKIIKLVKLYLRELLCHCTFPAVEYLGQSLNQKKAPPALRRTTSAPTYTFSAPLVTSVTQINTTAGNARALFCLEKEHSAFLPPDLLSTCFFKPDPHTFRSFFLFEQSAPHSS